MLDGGQKCVNSNSKIRSKSILKDWKSKLTWGRVKLLQPKWLLLPLLQTAWSHFVFHSLLFSCMRGGTQICCTDVFVYVDHGFSSTLTFVSMKWKSMHFHLKTCFDPKLGCFMDWLSAILIVCTCCAHLRLYMCHCTCHWDEWEYTLCPVVNWFLHFSSSYMQWI